MDADQFTPTHDLIGQAEVAYARLDGRRSALFLEVARHNGRWTIYDTVEDLIEPDDLAVALDGNAAARRVWGGLPPSARKQMLWWVVSAAKDDTRARRIATIVDKAQQGERATG